MGQRRAKPPRPARQYLGTWVLPSGNSADVYLVGGAALHCRWDTPPSPAWSVEDIAHYRGVTFPAILRAVQMLTGQSVLGVQA